MIRNLIKKMLPSEAWLAILFILALGALAYLPLANQMGYYRDDWHVAWAGRTLGFQQIIDLHKTDRPFMGVVYALTYLLLGDAPLAWHLYAIGARLAGALLFLWLVRLLWPGQRLATVWMAALFVVYPGFLQLPTASAYQNHLVGLNLGLLSIIFTVLSVKSPTRRAALVPLAMLTALVCYLMMEWMIGLEGVRLVLLWYLLSQDQKQGFWLQAVRTFKYWLPNLAAAGGFLGWRVLIFKSARAVTDVGALVQKYLLDAGFMLLRLIIETAKDVYSALFLAWAVPFYDLTASAAYLDMLAAILLACAAIGVLLLFWAWAKRQSGYAAVEHSPSSSSWTVSALWIGVLSIFATVVPVVLANRSVEFRDTFDRYTLSASMGASMAIVGAIFHFFSARPRLWAMSLLLAVSILTHYNNNVYFRNFWNYQKQLWWQLSWRAPDLKQDTAIIALLPQGYRLAESYEVWGPANLIYGAANQPMKVVGEVLNEETLPSILHADSYGRVFRRIPFTIDFKNSLVVSLPGSGACLHVLDGQALELSENEDPMIRLVAGLSNVELIEPAAQPKAPPAEIFGQEPQRTWCYYYQKTALARQRSDWEEVVRLGDEAAAHNLMPQDASEWMPFYQGYARLGRLDEANEIGARLRGEANFINLYCDQMKESDYQPADPVEEFIIQNLCPSG